MLPLAWAILYYYRTDKKVDGMKTKIFIQIIGVLIGIGFLTSYLIFSNGMLALKLEHPMAMLIGVADILRWTLAGVAAVLLIKPYEAGKWFLLTAFICGLFSSWVSFLPFGGYLMKLVPPSPDSSIQYFMVLQLPNIIIVAVIFFLFARLRKTPTRGK